MDRNCPIILLIESLIIFFHLLIDYVLPRPLLYHNGHFSPEIVNQFVDIALFMVFMFPGLVSETVHIFLYVFKIEKKKRRIKYFVPPSN
jgi:hypothetical protein